VADSSVIVESDMVKVTKIQFSRIEKLGSTDPDLARKLYFTLARQLAQWVTSLTNGSLSFSLTKKIAPEFSGPHSQTQEELRLVEEFKLPRDEVVVRAYKCQFAEGSMGTKHDGTLLVTQEYFLFFGKVFSMKKRVVIRIDEVTSISTKKKSYSN